MHGDRRRPVHAGQQGAVDRAGNPRAEGRDIGADVGDGVDLEREEVSVPVERELGAGLVPAALIVRHEAFAARRDPSHRTPQAARGPCDDRLFRIVLSLVAEAAADVGGDQPDRGLRQAKLLGDRAADVMRHLGRAIERQLAGAAIRQHGAGLDGRADQPVVGEIEPDHMRRAFECLLHGGHVAARKSEADVAGRAVVQLRRALLDCLAAVDDRRKRLIFDVDKFGGALRLRMCLRNHRGDRLADVAHGVARQRPARRLRHRLAVGGDDGPERRHRADLVGRHVGAGEHGDDAGQAAADVCVDPADPGMGMRRAQPGCSAALPAG